MKDMDFDAPQWKNFNSPKYQRIIGVVVDESSEESEIDDIEWFRQDHGYDSVNNNDPDTQTLKNREPPKKRWLKTPTKRIPLNKDDISGFHSPLSKHKKLLSKYDSPRISTTPKSIRRIGGTPQDTRKHSESIENSPLKLFRNSRSLSTRSSDGIFLGSPSRKKVRK